jgi:c-di-GMP phosphodiesterase
MSGGTPWWRRWLGAVEPPAAAPGSSARATPAPAARAAPPGPAEPPRLPAGALRRPLIGRQGRVAAWEWTLLERERQPPALWAQLLTVAAGSDRPGLVQLSAEAALRLAVRSVVSAGPPGRVAAVLEGVPDAATAAQLRAAGWRVGAPALKPAAEPALDLVVATASDGGLDTLLRAAERWREVQPRAQLVALGLVGAAEAEQALAGGFDLAGGQLAKTHTTAGPTRPLSAAAHRICALLGRLAADDDTAALAEAVRGDVALGYRLLRYANSPAIGLSRPAETVEQAIAVLGRRELQRWLQVMLIGAAAARPAQKALEEHALVRARLLERLAQRRGEADPAAFFTLGLVSTLDQLLQVPLATAVAPLKLRDEAQQALLARRGPWAPQLALLDAIDAPDESLAWAAAHALGQAEVLAEEAEAAWAWVAAVMEAPG